MIIKFEDTEDTIDLGVDDQGCLIRYSESNKELLMKVIQAVMNGDNELVSVYDEEYNQVDSAKYLSYYGNPILEVNPFSTFDTEFRSYLAKNIHPYQIDQINTEWNQLKEIVQRILFTFNLPSAIREEFSVKSILKDFQVGVDLYKLNSFYDKISTMIRLDSLLRPGKVMIFCDLSAYLTESELEQLEELCVSLKIKAVLIN